MPDFQYQIKGRQGSVDNGLETWAWPPIFSGLVAAPDKKAAKVLIEEEYGRKFPLRVLRKDLDEHAYLLHITLVNPGDDYIMRRYRDTPCKECGDVFKPIDKYNDPHADYSGAEYCSKKCSIAGRAREVRDFEHVSAGKVPAVIYKVQQLSTGRVYVGQTTQPFTLRWWQHLTQPSDCKFHSAMKSTDITDWSFSVIEVVEWPADCKNKLAYITERERHWIEELDAVGAGYNSVRPRGLSPQENLALEAVTD